MAFLEYLRLKIVVFQNIMVFVYVNEDLMDFTMLPMPWGGCDLNRLTLFCRQALYIYSSA